MEAVLHRVASPVHSVVTTMEAWIVVTGGHFFSFQTYECVNGWNHSTERQARSSGVIIALPAHFWLLLLTSASHAVPSVAVRTVGLCCFLFVALVDTISIEGPADPTEECTGKGVRLGPSEYH